VIIYVVDIHDDLLMRCITKEEKGLLRDVIGAAQQQQESKTRKYIRNVLAVISMLAFMGLIVAAAMRKFGS